MLVEVVVEDLRLAGARLQPRPGPGVPAERGVAHQVAGGLGHANGAGRIGREELVGEGAEALLRARAVFLRRLLPREAQAFVGVVAQEDRHVVVPARFVELVLVVRDHEAVDDRPGGAAAKAGGELAGGELSEVGDRRSTGLPREGHAGLLGVGETLHVLARIGGGTRRAERAAALRDGPVEETLGLRRRGKHAHRDAARRLPEDRHLARDRLRRPRCSSSPIAGRR